MNPQTVRRREWVGVLGGSFDPVHLGHLRIAEEVTRVFSLRRVLLVPCAVPPHKPETALSPAKHRLRMLQMATEERPELEVSSLELDRGDVSYTIDTLRALTREPGSPSPVFIMGMDSLLEIPTWRDHESLLEGFDFVVVDRPNGADSAAAAGLEAHIERRIVPVPGETGAGAPLLARKGRPGGSIYHLAMEPVPISSSRIRGLAARGEPLDGLVPPSVDRYIRSAGLYRGRKPTEP